MKTDWHFWSFPGTSLFTSKLHFSPLTIFSHFTKQAAASPRIGAERVNHFLERQFLRASLSYLASSLLPHLHYNKGCAAVKYLFRSRGFEVPQSPKWQTIRRERITRSRWENVVGIASSLQGRPTVLQRASRVS